MPTWIFGQNIRTRIDSINGYKLDIPDWLTIRESGIANTFGGTLPPVNGIENAIVIAAFPKSEFRSFDHFKEIYLTGNKFGQPTKYNKDQLWYGQKQLKVISNGVEQSVFIAWNHKIYHDKFVLLETDKSFLWIQFIATGETYDINIGKFEEFMSGLRIDKNPDILHVVK